MIMELYKLGYNGCDTFITCFDNTRELLNFINRQAEKMNYGIYRLSVRDDRIYFDCGPVVFYVDDLGDNSFGF